MIAKTLIALIILLGLPHPRPDEGQWLPEQFLAMDWDALKQRGLEMTKEEFWHPEKGGVLSAAVQINGCSASFVSADGLVVTNHHCGFGAIQRLSSVSKNYVEQGFVAADREAELPAPGMVVYVMKAMTDVTERVHAAMAKAKTDLERHYAEGEAIAAIVAEAEAAEKDVSCRVSSFLNGRKYTLFTRTMIQDVRLVYAPPRSVGEYGGEVDNWEWPRHTGDFTFFRAYVAPDGSPASYAKENVPFAPDHFLKVARHGVDEGDLVLILGYPGRTERYLTSVAVSSRERNLYPLRHEMLTGIIDVIEEVGASDPARALAMSSRKKSLANVEKNALGMIHGLRRNGVVARKELEEATFSEWVASDAAREQMYGKILPELLELDALEARYQSHDEVLSQILRNLPALGNLIQICGAVQEAALPEDQRDRGFDPRLPARALSFLAQGRLPLEKDLEVPMAAIVFEAAKGLPADAQLGNIKELMGELDGAGFARLAYESLVFDQAQAEALAADGGAALATTDDALVRVAYSLANELRATRLRNRTMSGRRLVLGRDWIEAQQAWRGKSFYPDANSTLRVSIASVKGYAPRDGAFYVPQTTLAGILDKERGEEPFKSPETLLEKATDRASSRFVDQELGDVPVCFLSDGDTTGGNSGSPVINGRGELVGLNFDRVFENVAGDFGWNPDRSRNVSCDIRYALWIMEQVFPAPHLLREMGF